MSTKRAESIFKSLNKDQLFDLREPKQIPQEAINDIHDFQLWSLYNAAAQLPDNEAFYPSVFLQRSQIRPDPTNLKHAGHKLDPIGDFQLETEGYQKMGKLFKKLDLPTVILQEGGYYTKDLGKNVLSFLQGFA